MQVDFKNIGELLHCLVRALALQPDKDQEGYLAAVCGRGGGRGDVAHSAATKALARLPLLSCQ